jgi:hypothetical protein
MLGRFSHGSALRLSRIGAPSNFSATAGIFPNNLFWVQGIALCLITTISAMFDTTIIYRDIVTRFFVVQVVSTLKSGLFSTEGSLKLE